MFLSVEIFSRYPAVTSPLPCVYLLFFLFFYSITMGYVFFIPF
ncbi:hypothetical protein LTSERUB_6761 [Salmonella enterica subsp. enterica serovar Rubislaw str. A4-653]|uniref:Uncharacterized protein n=1 Tax=Salmonella enterica subsp. enterica serovar Rubislaw str. A4-653 TaxID=913081 RepID=G5QCQ2_SALRU|nr:hypothetical protein LTSERUB_6761 [Salmonella enterica subsp. enterica serovar Rubislaw str. A4-653]